ncbi:MAG: guanylate kinase [Proteobacteria bacterium]|jgi:guanylate kinase|nr:guanylate kinase [Pseudomonadota bacterium]OEU62557.1 MAG: guanylate kinase [Desulfobacterales bacterium S5133MH16]
MNEHESRPSGSNSKEINSRQGHLFIISAPSGGGKTTLSKAVVNRFKDILYSVSYTTRSPRNSEQDGVDYYFIQKKDFEERIESGYWAEWAEVHGNYYGTSAEFLEKGLASGRDMLLDIDVQGTIQILGNYPDSITFFIMPPSLETLRKRLEMRRTESRTTIERRLLTAEKEMAQKDLYRYIIVNDQLSVSIEKLVAIIEKYHYKKKIIP